MDITSLIRQSLKPLGSHVTDRLLADGFDVTVIDNLSSGRKKNIEHILDNPQLSFHELDNPQLLPLDT